MCRFPLRVKGSQGHLQLEFYRGHDGQDNEKYSSISGIILGYRTYSGLLGNKSIYYVGVLWGITRPYSLLNMSELRTQYKTNK